MGFFLLILNKFITPTSLEYSALMQTSFLSSADFVIFPIKQECLSVKLYEVMHY